MATMTVWMVAMSDEKITHRQSLEWAVHSILQVQRANEIATDQTALPSSFTVRLAVAYR